MNRLFLLAAATILTCAPAFAQWQEQVLYHFQGSPDGAYPTAGLVADAHGNLYGTTMGGGTAPSTCYGVGCGTVFELSPNSNGTWSEKVLYTFCASNSNCPDGSNPLGGLVFDGAGNLYGTTQYGGNFSNCSLDGCGVVFELSPSGSGSWTYSTLHAFCAPPNDECQDGANPRFVTLTVDAKGNLYGTAQAGGSAAYSYSGGVVFELSPGAKGWTETVIYNFCSQGGKGVCPDGSYPQASVTFDKAGNLYGTTWQGGKYQQKYAPWGNGVVFELSPGASGWTEKALFAFPASGVQGSNPQSDVSFDGAGNLYSTVTYEGGGFRLKSDGQFGEIHVPSGLYPNGGVLVDSTQGKLYATAASNSGGNVYQFTASNQLTTIYAFCSLTDCDDGSAPEGDLIQDASGNIYGTTTYGGPYQQGDYGTNGVVFELSPQ